MRSIIAILACLAGAGTALADCPGELRAMLEKSDAAMPRHVETTMKSQAGDTLMIQDIETPTRFRTRTEGAGFTQELLILDDKGWTSSGTTRTALPAGMAKTMAGATAVGRKSVLDSIDQAECLGEQPKDGASYIVYRMRTQVQAIVTRSTVFADPATGLTTLIDYETETANGKASGTTSFRYDSTLTIQPPG